MFEYITSLWLSVVETFNSINWSFNIIEMMGEERFNSFLPLALSVLIGYSIYSRLAKPLLFSKKSVDAAVEDNIKLQLYLVQASAKLAEVKERIARYDDEHISKSVFETK